MVRNNLKKKGMTFGDLEDLLYKCVKHWGDNLSIGIFAFPTNDEIFAVMVVKDKKTANIVKRIMSKGIEAIEKEESLSFLH